MSISQINSTGWGYSTSNPTRVLGTAAAGDMRVAIVINKPGSTVSLDQGFTHVGSALSTTGVGTGVDVGPTEVEIWVKETDGSDNGLTLTATIPNNSVSGMNTAVVRKTDAAKDWSIQFASGEDLVGNTTWSATLSPNVDLTSNSFCYVYSAIPTDVTTPNQWTAEALSASGITFLAGAALPEADSGLGNDIGGHGWRGGVNTGSGNVAVTYTATGTGTVTNAYGPTALLVLDEVDPPNVPPTANAGTDQSVSSGATVNLDGSGSSDSDGSITAWAWTQTAGTTVSLTGATTATPSFTAPEVNETLTFQLQVTDNDSATDTDTVDVIVTIAPAGPTFDWHVQGGSDTPVTSLEWHNQGGSDDAVTDTTWHTQA